MLMMLDPSFSSKLVSKFNALFSKRFGSYFFVSDNCLIIFPVLLMFLDKST